MIIILAHTFVFAVHFLSEVWRASTTYKITIIY